VNAKNSSLKTGHAHILYHIFHKFNLNYSLKWFLYFYFTMPAVTSLFKVEKAMEFHDINTADRPQVGTSEKIEYSMSD